MNTPRLELVSTQTAVTYCFRAAPGTFGWANCTVNEATGDLAILSDFGSWSHRWHVGHLGVPTLTAFIGQGDVDYLARKLQGGGSRAGQRWSAAATARALRRLLCERRLEDGREQLENRLDPEDMPGRIDRYTEDGLPIFSYIDVAAPRWNDPKHREPLPYLTRNTARRIWDAIGKLAGEIGTSFDLFFDRVQQIDGFDDYVTDNPGEYGETEQTPEDRALREIVLPALIEACRARAATPPPATPTDEKLADVRQAVQTASAAIARVVGDRPIVGVGAAARIVCADRPSCTNNSPPGFAGHWRDWHRGHGCDKDDGKPRTPAAAAEIAAGGAR